MKQATLADLKETLEAGLVELDARIAALKDRLGDERLDWQLATDKDRTRLAAKVSATTAELRGAEEERAGTVAAIGKAQDRETQQAARDAEAQRQRVVRAREKLLADRGVVHERIRTTAEALAEDLRSWLDFTAQIDNLTTSPAIRATPIRIRSMLQSWLFGLLGKDGGSGLDEMPYIRPELRAFPANEP